MATFAPIRGTRAQIQNTPNVDGQFLVETDQGANNRILMDDGNNRSVIGGGAGMLPRIVITAPSGTTVSDITVTNPSGSTSTVTSLTSTTFECIVNDGYGNYTIAISGVTSSLTLNVNSVKEYRVEYDNTATIKWNVSSTMDCVFTKIKSLNAGAGTSSSPIVFNDSNIKVDSVIEPFAESVEPTYHVTYQSISVSAGQASIVIGTNGLAYAANMVLKITNIK